MKYILVIPIFMGVFFIVPQLAVSEQLSQTIRCESEEFTPRNCPLPVAPRNAEIKEIRKIQQLSTKPCIEGKTWVANQSVISVSNGCRADFKIVYWLPERSEHRERWREPADARRWEERPDEQISPTGPGEDPTEIVLQAFEDILNKRPSKDEMSYYRSLIIDRGWTERQIRNDLRNRSRSGNRIWREPPTER